MVSEVQQAFDKLDLLKRQGIIDDEEYASRRRKLIDDFVGQPTAATSLAVFGEAAPSSASQELVLCSVHDKYRYTHYMVRSGEDNTTWNCITGHECRMNRTGHPAILPGDWICLCGTNNFARRTRCFTCAAPRGQWQNSSALCNWGPFANVLFGRDRRTPSVMNEARFLCCTHHKMRSANALVHGTDGAWHCKPSMQCKGPSSASD
eukprot:TRINITY_DN10636_c0_g1_i1.p1 TRINITY_DN10636_c0_g1~~TRINITY_DN10636_c0_g1_i1.p1  ORF type:complete len:219 (-),score=20.28 TRINITY_DN10636_c0_g1_i1:879-1496(-)